MAALVGVVVCLGGCGSGASPDFLGGPSVSINMAALNLQGVGDVVWDVEVVNGADPAQVVWQKRLSSTGYGDSAGSASYVGPCDADPGVNENTVKVWVVGVYSSPVATLGTFASGAVGGATPPDVEFQNPTTDGALTQVATCQENADVFVQFDVALMRPAQQGFFDIAVNFNNIFCSAKFDCCADTDANGCATDGTEDIELLFDASGARSSTMVLGFACTAGATAGVETELYLDALQLDCTTPTAETFAADITLNPSGPAGNQCTAGADGMSTCTGVVTESNGVDADAYLYQLAIFRGLEQLQSGGVDAQKVYWNLALGVKRAETGADITDCWLRTQGTADDANGTSIVALGNIAAGAVYPYIQWDVNLATCGAEPLTFGDASAMVRADYTTTGGAGRGFAYGYGPNLTAGPFCAVVCANGGQCVSNACVCATGFSGATCETNDDDCVGDPCAPGTCIDGVAGYTCTCPDGAFDDGATCAACTPITNCVSGLTCTTAADSICAVCDTGYAVPDCANTDDCDPNPCLNGGTCMDGVDSYTCSCIDGYLGTNCETPPAPQAPAGFSCTGTVCANDTTGEVWVPAGDFWMGCNSVLDGDCRADESSQHLVTLSEYVIDRGEVTASEYAACVSASACSAAGAGGNSTYGVSGKESHPINYVDWNQASAYCAWNKPGIGVQRLCTEAEWEKAARGGCDTVTGDCADGSQMRKYPWDAGDGSAPVEPTCESNLANFNSCVGSTTAVGGYPGGMSPYGAYDMAGNVWEWVSDWYTGSYGAGAVTDPTGPPSGSPHVRRGGSFSHADNFVRASRRDHHTPSFAGNYIGIRCCRSLP